MGRKKIAITRLTDERNRQVNMATCGTSAGSDWPLNSHAKRPLYTCYSESEMIQLVSAPAWDALNLRTTADFSSV
jgi:hypothetical protein